MSAGAGPGQAAHRCPAARGPIAVAVVVVTVALALLLSGCVSSLRVAADPRSSVGRSTVGRSTASQSTASQSTASQTSGRSLPPVHAQFSYQLGGAYAPAAGVGIVDRDHTDPPAPGKYSICYLNAFQAQADAVAWWRQHHAALLLRDGSGGLVTDQQWGEPLLDISTPARRTALLAIVGGWIDGCAAAGFHAVEADNLDSYTRSEGRLTVTDALAFARLIAARAHRDHLAIAQKNAAELSPQAHAAGFDFAVAEECQMYTECGSYTAVYGRHVIEIEYTDNPLSVFTTACAARGATISVVLRDRDVTPAGDRHHVERWCGAADG